MRYLPYQWNNSRTNWLMVVAILLASQIANGQFNNVSGQIGQYYVEENSAFTSGIGFYDFNSDGWDDLSIGRGTASPVFLVNQEGTFVPADFIIPNSDGSNIAMLLWVDLDNDGDNDLIISKFNGPLELWENDGDFNFTNIAAEAGLSIANRNYSGIACADYNHDGCIDIFVAKYYNPGQQIDYQSILYKNNCNQTFTDVTEEAGLEFGAYPIFQPVFLDYNRDGWEDLYLIDELSTSPNRMFRNNGDGAFTDVSEQTGTGIYIDAMTATVGDVNNDHFPDIFVTNRPSTGGNHLLVNEGGSGYSNAADTLGFGLDYGSYGAVWLDHNNNGWQDIFVSMPFPNEPYEGNEFYINNQGLSFTASREVMGFGDDYAQTYTCARGDYNNDGYFDLVHSSLYESPVHLYENSGGLNNFLAVSLEGTLSNRDGIGSWIYCYAGDHQASYFTMCGENLIGQNSDKYIFGLGEATMVDSLVIEWNSGTREVYLQPEINTHHYFVEGSSFTQPFAIAETDSIFLCPGENTLLDAGPYEDYLWSTGDTTQTISVSEPGTYSVEVWNEFGLSVTSFPVEVAVAPPAEITFDKANVSCAGANDGAVEVTFSNGPIAEILWNTGDTVATLDGLGPEVYSFTATDDFGCPVEGSVSISEPPPLLALGLVTDVWCFGEPTGTADLNIIGGTPPYSVDWWGENPEALYAGSYSVSVSDTNGCNIDIGYEIEQPDSLVLEVLVEPASNGASNGSASLTISGGTPTYSTSWSTGETDVLNIVDLATGNYSVSVTDGNYCAADTTFMVDTNTGMHGVKESNAPVLYPNPNTGAFRIAHCPAPVVKIEVIDAMGRTIIPAHTISCGSPVSFDGLSPGQYSLILTHTSFRQFMRLVIIE